MSVIYKLATSLGRRDEAPNQELAKFIVDKNDKEGVKELIEHLQNNNNRKIQNDCIKTLYEIGYIKPDLISSNTDVFVGMLKNKNNRLVWGSMIAIDTITDIVAGEVYKWLSAIMVAIDNGSVITKDAGVEILAKLSVNKKYTESTFPLLIEQLKFCPAKQLGQYAEKALQAISERNKEEFIQLLNSRVPDLERDSQRKRINKVLKELN